MNSDDHPNKDDKDKSSKAPPEGTVPPAETENKAGDNPQVADAVNEQPTDEKPAPEIEDQEALVKPPPDAVNQPHLDNVVGSQIAAVLRDLQSIKNEIAKNASIAASNVTLTQAKAAWVASLIPALDKEIELLEQQIIASRAAANVQQVAADTAAALKTATETFTTVENATSLEPLQQAKETLEQLATTVADAMTQANGYVADATSAVTNAKTHAVAPLWGKELEDLRLKRLGYVPIVAVVAVVIIIFFIIRSLSNGNDQVAWIFAGIVATVILISVGFYRPQRVRITQSRASTTSSDGKTEAPSLPSTHPAVLALGIYMVIFTLLCLGLVLDIGSQSSDLQLTSTPTATSTPEKTPDAKVSSASQVNVIPVDVHSVAAQATEAATAESTQEATSEATAPPKTDTTSPQSNTPSTQIYFIHLPDRTIPITGETRLLLLIVLSGALGGLLKSIQSYRSYLGEDNFKGSWIMYYVTEPFVGSVLALLFYVVIRGGLFSNESVQSANTFGLVATSGLVGLFNGQAMKKLKQIAEIVFTANVSQDPLAEDKKKEEAKNTPITSSSSAVVNPQTGEVALVEETTKKADTSTG